MDIEKDELQFIIDDLKEQLQEVKDEKKLIKSKYKRLINKIIEVKLKRKSLFMTKEQEEIIGVFRMQL